MPRPRMGRRVWARLPELMIEQIDAAAERDGRTRSDWMRRALGRALEHAMPQSPNVSSWIVPPECQGQIVELAYGQDDEGQCWERVTDRAINTISYRDLGHSSDDACQDWQPWNERPACAACEPIYEAAVRPADAGFGEHQQGEPVTVETDAETIDEYVATLDAAVERPDIAATLRRWGPNDTRTWRVFQIGGAYVSFTR